MANKLNGFLDNVVSGALSPKGNLGDFAHAARLYVDDAHRLSPKHKLNYELEINDLLDYDDTTYDNLIKFLDVKPLDNWKEYIEEYKHEVIKL